MHMLGLPFVLPLLPQLIFSFSQFYTKPETSDNPRLSARAFLVCLCWDGSRQCRAAEDHEEAFAS